MKSKRILGVLMMAALYLSMSLQVFASAKKAENNDLSAVPHSEFQGLVEEILTITQEHPEWTQENIMQFLDERINLHKEVKGSIGDIWNALTDSEKKLIIRYPFDALKVNQAKDVATSQTELKFGYNGLGDKSDAFRHGIWNAEMAILIGVQKAELFATAHEDKDTTGMESDGYSKAEHKNMDLHNNAVGRQMGITNSGLSDNELSDIIYENINQEQSDFIWLHE